MSQSVPENITAIPLSPMGWSFDLFRGGEKLVRIESAWLREHGSFRLDGNSFEINKDGFLGGNFSLLHDRQPITQAKHALFGRSFSIESGNTTFHLRRAGWFGRSLTLHSNSQRVGSITMVRMFSRRARVGLPDTLTDAEKIFVFWLGTVIWRRDASESV